MELYANDQGIIPQDSWYALIDRLKAQTLTDDDAAIGELLSACSASVVQATLDRAKPAHELGEKIGIFFSGGVDSTTLAFILQQHGIPFTCYTAGFQDEGTKEPEDVAESKKISRELGFEHKITIISKDTCHDLFTKTAKLIPRHVLNPVTLGVGSVIVAAADLAVNDGCTTFFAGLGSEELYAGYQRHDEANIGAMKEEQSNALQEECWRGLRAMWSRDLERDCAIAQGLGLTVHTPLLDKDVIQASMKIPGEYKIRAQQLSTGEVHKSVKKWCFRIIAEELGLREEFAWRPKRAAQYGSRMDAAMEKTARARGMGKKEYCESLSQ